MHKRKAKKNTGFSFLEMLLNIAFLCFLVGVAAPSFSDYLKTNEIFSQRQSIHSEIQDAREIAIRRSKSVSICPLDKAMNCGVDWSQGWLVFVDDGKGSDGVAHDGVLNGAEEILSVSSYEGMTNVSVKDLDSQFYVDAISFNYLGRPQEKGKESNKQILITVCDKANSSELARGLLLSEIGLVKRTRDYDNDGVHEMLRPSITAYTNTYAEIHLRCS